MKYSMLLIFFGLISLADTYEYKIEGMTCSNCKKMVKASICALPGIKLCIVDIGSMKLTAEDGKTIDQAAITKTLEELNIKNREAYKITSSKKVDDTLPPNVNEMKPVATPETKDTKKVKQ